MKYLRGSLLVCLLSAWLFLFSFPVVRASDTIFVSQRDSVQMESLKKPSEKAENTNSLRDAIWMASRGDVIIVTKGYYQEGNIVINKQLSLIGIGYPVIDGGNTNEVFTILADSVRLSGFQVQNCGVSYVKDLAGIKIDNFSHCIIENNKLINTFFGIYLKNANHCVIRNNNIEGKARDEFSSGNAIHIWYSKDILVDGNTCIQHRDGIYFEFVENSTITRNISEKNLRYGLHFMFSNHDDYIGNIFRNNGAGVAVMFSNHIIMKENLFENNWGSNAYGLLLKDITDGEISNNRFIENTIGIYGDGANRIKMESNEFRNNGWALKILGSCAGNVIAGNNFISNTFDVLTNNSTNYNEYNGNFWSDYTGYDLDRDGAGDVPYKPVKLFSLVAGKVPSAIILLRSPFVDLINFAEKVMPSLTPQTLEDKYPLMKQVTFR
jgi:nitrous oxidase accessory protein